MKLDTYFPWVQRVAEILRWVWRIMTAQIQPDYCLHYPSEELWEPWDDAAWEGVRSTRRSPWWYQAGWKGVYGNNWENF